MLFALSSNLIDWVIAAAFIITVLLYVIIKDIKTRHMTDEMSPYADTLEALGNVVNPRK